jgi:hypothetical protein
MKLDQEKYKVVCLATNQEWFFGAKAVAIQKAKAIDGMLMMRQVSTLRYEHLDTYRYGRKR